MTGKRIPITNAGVGYTATIRVGSHGSAANVILDTGSSALAVTHTAYRPQHDSAINPTDLAQDITYRTGGWVGPVVTTTLALGGIELSGSNIAIALEEEPQGFGSADGILGLAYDPLNDCYDLSAYLRHLGAAATYPWPFPARNSMAAVKHLTKLFSAMPKKTLIPFFTQLVDAGKAANKFAFYTRRSVPHATRHAENAGFFILGGGEEQHDLYQGTFVTVAVVHDKHYNTTLKAVRVGHAAPVHAHPLPHHFERLISNSVIDSGSDNLALATDVFKAIMAGLDPGLAHIATRALDSRNGIPNAEVELARWPDITFILAGEHGRDVPLVCAPETYWQLDAGEPGRALFRINPFGQVLSILGLPLLNNHYVVFDRSVHRNGVVRFAKIK